MENPKRTESQTQGERDAKTAEEPLSEATSEKTVSDLEESVELSNSKPATPSDETSIPAPDGTPKTEHADDSDTSGPM